MKAKRLLANLAIFLLSGFIIVYIIIQLISGLTQDVSFELAEVHQIDDVVERECYLARNESLIYAEQSGITTYSVSEVQKIGTNQLIATVFSDTHGVDLQQKIKKIDEKIKILERSAIDTSYLTSDVAKIDAKIYNSLVKIHRSITQDDISLAKQHKEDLLINYNKRQIITSDTESFDSRIESLKKEKEALTSSLQNPLCSVYAKNPGYFSTLLDGYESIFTPQAIENLTVDSYHELISRSPQEVSDLAIGKIITDFHWFALCEMDSEQADEFSVGETYPVTFLYSSGDVLDAKIERKITQTDTDQVVLVFLIEEVPQDFDYSRKQSIRIIKEKITGLTFPHSALRLSDGIQGVYIIDGNSVAFRKVDIVYSSNSQYFSREKASNDENAKEYLSRYDRVIVEGKDLYVGKLLD